MRHRELLPTIPRWSVLGVLQMALLGLPLLPGIAQGQNSLRDPVGAEDLFRRAMQQLEEGDWAGACDRFQKSMDLDPSVSTLAKIARCREHEGKLATAWYDYERALKLALDTDMTDRRRHELEEHIRLSVAAIEPRIPKLRITVEPVPTGLEVTRDGTWVALSALGEPLPVDPGEHEIIARAPGFVDQKKVVVVEESSSAEAKLQLTAAPPTAEAKPPPSAERPPKLPIDSAPRHASDTQTYSPSPGSGGRAGSGSAGFGWSAAGLVLGGAGLATLGAAGYFGLHTLSLVSDSNSHCSEDDRCDQEGVRLRRDAGDAETTALVLAGAGAAAVGFGVVLFAATSQPATANHQASSARVVARVGPTFVLARGIW